MTVYQALSVIRVVILVALGALFMAMAAGRVPAQRRRALIAILVVAAALSYPNFGYLHNHGDRYRHLHLWDTFHYFMGAKYLPELGYVHLYDATLAAGRELGAFANVREVRDLTTYLRRDAGSVDAAAVVARFN